MWEPAPGQAGPQAAGCWPLLGAVAGALRDDLLCVAHAPRNACSSWAGTQRSASAAPPAARCADRDTEVRTAAPERAVVGVNADLHGRAGAPPWFPQRASRNRRAEPAPRPPASRTSFPGTHSVTRQRHLVPDGHGRPLHGRHEGASKPPGPPQPLRLRFLLLRKTKQQTWKLVGLSSAEQRARRPGETHGIADPHAAGTRGGGLAGRGSASWRPRGSCCR